MDDSSGGWTTAMAAVTGGVAELEGGVGVRGPSSAVQGGRAVLSADGLRADGRPHAGQLQRFQLHLRADARSPESRLVGCTITACLAKVTAANPLSYRGDRRTPPFLILHGEQDAPSAVRQAGGRRRRRTADLLLRGRPPHGLRDTQRRRHPCGRLSGNRVQRAHHAGPPRAPHVADRRLLPPTATGHWPPLTVTPSPPKRLPPLGGPVFGHRTATRQAVQERGVTQPEPERHAAVSPARSAEHPVETPPTVPWLSHVPGSV